MTERDSIDLQPNFVKSTQYEIGIEGGVIENSQVYEESEFEEYIEKLKQGLYKTQKPEPCVTVRQIVSSHKSVADLDQGMEDKKKINNEMRAWSVLKDGVMIKVPKKKIFAPNEF